jgi:ferredoxin-NADP reductase/DMSO/TMAO reductase YedYZ heme-binding membrane subunit
VRIACGAAVVAGLVLVVSWWVADGGLAELTGRSGGAASIGRLAGLVGSDLLLVQVLMMARIPAVERAVGLDRLARGQRITGAASLALVLVHVALTTWSYSGPDGFWGLITTDAGGLLALAGAVCLVPVAVLGGRPRRRSWRPLHLYAYLGVGLALPHQLWTGQEFLTSPAATAYWWTLWAAAAAAVLLCRVGLPIARNLRHDLRVSAVVPEAGNAVSVHLTGRALERLPAVAGQFLVWRFRTATGWSRARPYPLSAAPDGRGLRITVAAVGDGSALVRRLRLGTPAVVEGPYGRLPMRPGTGRRIALIGAGVGVAPLRALAEALPYAPGDAVLLQRASREPLFVDELDALAAVRGLAVVPLTGPRRPGSWLGTDAGSPDDLDLLRGWVPDIADRDVYVCGPPGWTAAVRRTLIAAGLPASRMHVEDFAWPLDAAAVTTLVVGRRTPPVPPIWWSPEPAEAPVDADGAIPVPAQRAPDDDSPDHGIDAEPLPEPVPEGADAVDRAAPAAEEHREGGVAEPGP